MRSKRPSQLCADHEPPTPISASSGVTTVSAARLLGIADRATVGAALKKAIGRQVRSLSTESND